MACHKKVEERTTGGKYSLMAASVMQGGHNKTGGRIRAFY